MGKDKVSTVENTTSQTGSTGIDQASQDYITGIRGTAQQGMDAILNQQSPFFNGPTDQFMQGLGGLGGVLSQLQGGQFNEALQNFGYDPQGTGFEPGAVGDGGAMSIFQNAMARNQNNPAGRLGFNAGTFDPARAQSFFSPFQDEVVGGIQANADRQREQAMNRAAQEATGANAFGGSRSAMLQSQALRDVNQDEASLVANTRNQGYQNAMQQALGAFGTEQATGLGAATARMQGRLQDRQGMLSAGMQAAGLGQRGQIAQNDINFRNAAANMQDRQYGAGLDLNRAQALQQGNLQGLGQTQQAAQGLMAGGETLRGIQNQQSMEDLFRYQQALGLGQGGYMGPLGSTSSQEGTNTQTNTEKGDLWGDLLGAGLTVGGALIGGPVGASIGGGIGSMIGGKATAQAAAPTLFGGGGGLFGGMPSLGAQQFGAPAGGVFQGQSLGQNVFGGPAGGLFSGQSLGLR